MNCINLRKLLDKANEMAAKNIWGEKAFLLNMRIWAADNYNFTACTWLAHYYKLNDNIPDAKRMYFKAQEVYPNDYGVKENLIELERIQAQTKFMDKLTTSRDCYNSGQKLTQKGFHWLARGCYLKAYSIEPLLKYGVSLAKSYSKLGNYNRIKTLYMELMNNNTSQDIIEDIKIEFVELLKGERNVQEKVLTA